MNLINYCVIIDNNSVRGSALERTLREANITSQIKHTLNCGHALVYLREMREKFHNQNILVLLNVHTPIMSGLEFMDELKNTSYAKSSGVLFIAIGDHMKEEEKEKYRLKGINGFISSPFSEESFLNLLNEKFQPGTKPAKTKSKSISSSKKIKKTDQKGNAS